MQDILESAVSLLNVIKGKDFLLVGAGTPPFRGTISVAPTVEPGSEMGGDLRELSIIEAFQNDVSAVAQNNRITQVENGATWTVVKRENNEADFTTKLWVVAFVEGTDA